jgi:uncharacterized membrane protein
MILLVIGIVALAAIYLAPVPRFARLTMPVRTAIAVVALAAILVGWRLASPVPLYATPAWGWYGAFILNAAASLCLAQFIFRGKLRARLGSPLDLAIMLWGAGHLLVEGTLAGVLLFGGLILAGAIHLGFAMGNPPAAVAVRQGHDVMAVIAGAAIFGLLTQLHILLTGVPAFVLPRALSGP